MSQSPNSNSDQFLTSIYSQQASLYEQLLKMSNGLPDAFSQRQGTEDVLASMNKVMSQITQLNQQLAPIRDQWTSSGCKPSPELARAIKGVEQMIVGLIQQIDAAENSAKQASTYAIPNKTIPTIARRWRINLRHINCHWVATAS